VDGKFADTVLGRFQKGREQFAGILEGKGTRDPLDGPFAGRLTRSRARFAFRKSKCEQRLRHFQNLRWLGGSGVSWRN
jgi:hypothetical protein